MQNAASESVSPIGLSGGRPVSNATGADHAETSARTFRLVLYDALASEAMGTLTTGVFLVGFAVELGASNSAIGVLASVPFFVQLLQLPAVVVVERVRARRAICVWTSGIGRSFLLAAAFAPVVAASAGIGALIALLAVHQGLVAVSGCSWNSWMRDLVPEGEQGRFFGRRTAAATALATVLVLLVADSWSSGGSTSRRARRSGIRCCSRRARPLASLASIC
jgi:hypothetical protein